MKEAKVPKLMQILITKTVRSIYQIIILVKIHCGSLLSAMVLSES